MSATSAPAAARSQQREPGSSLDLVVVGGCGHVGLPLALSFAATGLKVGIYDIDAPKMERVREGQMPFREPGADELLASLLPTRRLDFDEHPRMLARTDTVVLVIGTPIDEFMNPSTRIFESAVDELAPHLQSDALVILRSTVYPGVTEYVANRLAQHGLRADVAFCPERVSEGHALEEIRSLPQLVGGVTPAASERAEQLFSRLDVEVVQVSPKEAELAKLLTNTWRYMKFAIANQFFQMAHHAGVDYDHVLHAIRHHYPRAEDLPGPGFAAGPCLFKDTMQLAAFSPDHFPMGHAAMLVNEGLPGFIVDALDRRQSLAGRTLGILGMAFKGESDDPRASLSYKLKKLAAFRGATVLCTDPYVPDTTFLPLEDVVRQSDALVIAAPHNVYQHLDLDGGKDVVDIWGITGGGIRL
jgi:UDP-N-acetyl-D-mannosaminuronic acid dehydrogenase